VENSNIEIRRATRADLPALGRLGALLMRTHYAFDAHRFLPPGDTPEEGYAWFLGTQLTQQDTAIFVAERQSAVIGYVYAGIEPLSWRELRDEAGFIHDIAVEERARRTGVAVLLMNAAIDWIRGRGVTRAMLWTAEQNAGAQRLFAALGFRRTMIEMTKELGQRL
jgi:ribosomal protein S18 acetylase RimI-like enzyme